MNIVFFGSSEFATPVLKSLLTAQHKISCVVTQPDSKKGRGLSFTGTVIKKMAQDAGLKVYQPQAINTPEAVNFLKGLNADLFIVIAYGQILSQKILDLPKIFALNIHASALPKYRGAAPINWAIINGEKTTGITIMKMSDKMDAGNIIAQKITEIDNNDTAVTLTDKLSNLAAELLLNHLRSIGNNDYKLTVQDEENVSFAPKLKKEHGLIDWKKSADDIHNLIRGCAGWPGAFTHYQGKLLKIYKAGIVRGSGDQGIRVSGKILEVSREGIVVACNKDNLVIQELQIEGKRRMTVEEFVAGHKISVGEILGKK